MTLRVWKGKGAKGAKYEVCVFIHVTISVHERQGAVGIDKEGQRRWVSGSACGAARHAMVGDSESRWMWVAMMGVV